MISKTAKIGKNVTIKEGVIIEDNVVIGDDCFLDYNVIIRKNVHLGKKCFVGANSILGEFLGDFFEDFKNIKHQLCIGDNALIRSECIIYGENSIGHNFSTGHRVTIREKTKIGHHVNIGTLSDIQGDCFIGNHVHLHSNVHVGMKTVINNYAWVFPYVVFTNDPTPPSNSMRGATVDEYAVICTGSTILPGIYIGKDALIGAGSNVTKNILELQIAFGNPIKVVGHVEDIKNEKGEKVYPWRYTFDRSMPWQNIGYDKWIKLTEEDENVEN